MAGGRRSLSLMSSVDSTRFSSRPIPKRGQVKAWIVIGIAHSFASLFSTSARRSANHFTRQHS
ncbi:hypothetical protein MKW98_024040 [Papaver atlanticum]|uniref:Uncharacterized protein n=1 Tax=Papaver atlanticum TaxID=357466 RepID=A0AAD4SZX2_9MAGN|nr:hypothetical protein MKX03_006918 [Papaver bracteatum]KAI3928439.1 hypothetical protein MKW98_024040 [Papaver atlanticum]KAI3960008.1 hypothetical protein MKW92_009107 [Papaver armeniacum]